MRQRRLSISVDDGRCALYGVCQQEAPEVFELVGTQPLSYRTHPETESRERVMAAARRCPMRAIEVRTPATGRRQRSTVGSQQIVVVGAGVAGLSAARRLRERGFTGELVVVGAERRPPYDRTAISKHFMAGELAARDLTLDTEGIDAQWLTTTRAEAVNVTKRVLRLEDGRRLRYDGMVIATGCDASLPRGFPNTSRRVWTLRTLDDAWGAREALAGTERVAVIGDGVLGTELAAQLRDRMLDVTLIGRQLSPLWRMLGGRIGTLCLLPPHLKAGVRLQLGVSVRSCVAATRNVALELDDGQHLEFDVVLVAVGSQPSVGWLRGSGIDTGGGVQCSPTCHVRTRSGLVLDDVVAAGDVARWPNRRFDTVARRVEHWIPAIDMGEAAADALLAGPALATPFTPVPRFWTEQFGVRIQVEGIPALGTRLRTLHGTPGEPGFVGAFTRSDGGGRDEQLVGVVAVDNPTALLPFHDIIGSSTPVD